MSNSMSKLRSRQVKKKQLKPWEFLEKQSETVTTKRSSDRTKIHFTSRYYKNIIHDSIHFRVMCLQCVMQLQYIKSNDRAGSELNIWSVVLTSVWLFEQLIWLYKSCDKLWEQCRMCSRATVLLYAHKGLYVNTNFKNGKNKSFTKVTQLYKCNKHNLSLFQRCLHNIQDQ